ncbi:hypothetical protein FHS29_007242 [Saccharothrix tamanrassetensis]|uniref:Uncharacterized protein n=1 Tax=Saccharothrix tamanrassetensis TaxID=1051531 RepID=A0A841CWD5_9PSEU|nr:hypothetical protein [Saccharothrix tamanrassetensis]MBB5960614.1 hypothetical protein [Saccharothrix tamanrassetensis]
MDRVEGISSAAPAPMPPRAAITCQGWAASAPQAAVAPHRASPVMKALLRPIRSVTAPVASTVPPRTRA